MSLSRRVNEKSFAHVVLAKKVDYDLFSANDII